MISTSLIIRLHSPSLATHWCAQFMREELESWKNGWDQWSILLVNLVFAALFLSLQMPDKLSTVLHEAIPQVKPPNIRKQSVVPPGPI